MDFFTQMDLVSNRFTKTEKKIAQYIQNAPDEILYVSITDLSSRIGVSETSIFRFCKTLGYEGYQECKMSLAKSLSIEDNLNDMDRKQITLNDATEDIISKLLLFNTHSLKQTVEMLDYTKIDEAVALIEKSEMVGFFGSGSSNITAADAKRKFSRVRKKVIHTMDLHDQIIMASSFDSGDLAIVYSYSGASKDILDVMRVLKDRQAHVILITRYAVSSATNFSDIILLCGSKGSFTGDSFSSKISQLFITDILYTSYYIKNYPQSKHIKTLSLDAISPRIY